jgi:GT2 family glycosyltransferase
MPPTLSILIVSYNTRQLTMACLDSIGAETLNTSFEIIVVDNASTDGSAAAIASHPLRPTLVALDTNVGFGCANNIAANHASGELLLLLNPDTVVLDGAIDRLVAFSRTRAAAGIWGGRTVFADGRLNPSSAWGRMTPWRLFCRAVGLTGLASKSALFNGEAIGGWQRDTEREVDIVSGCFFLLPVALWRRLGGFDPTFFMYGEEADLCLRAHALGVRPRTTPDATIIHLGGASETNRADKIVKLLAAKATLINRHFAIGSRRLGLALNAAWPLSRWIALALASNLVRNTAWSERAAMWHSVWQRRSEWQHGWDGMPDVVPRTTNRHTGSPVGSMPTAT